MTGTATDALHAPAPLLADHCVCPACHGSLSWAHAAVECTACHTKYRREDGIPIFTTFDEASTDEDVRYKLDQAEFFDAEGAEWEISRPHHTPALYGWLMAEKFRRSVRGLEGMLDGASVLTVCGGSGMDAEFLSREGAQVIASDISLGAAKRVQERGRRHGVTIFPIVADVEHLPFADRSLDVTYVHDGLHHLDDPTKGLSEMMRVATRAISVTEPVRAAVTQLAVLAGISLTVEDAGNRVERISPDAVARILKAGGFQLLGNHRYAMFYRHEPGLAMHVLSRRRTLPVATACLDAFNAVLGRAGNKGAIQAVRRA